MGLRRRAFTHSGEGKGPDESEGEDEESRYGEMHVGR